MPPAVLTEITAALGDIGYQQQHLEFARDIGPRFTVESCQLAEEYLTRFA